jgi:beta-1,4-mannosyl-glycoprotein beta-1,4-N-acetylglucosaminyltransferase
MRKIYDCFCFFNELDLLELRLNILGDYVDYFVISESSVTHTGQPKPYYYEENKERFSKWKDKIIHLKIEDTPNDFLNLPLIDDSNNFDNRCVSQIHNFICTQTNRFNRATEIHYGRDFYQKECIRRGLEHCNDEDIIISSDCDEIPNPEVLKNIDKILNAGTYFTLNQDTYYYYLNLLKEREWKGSRIGLYADLKDYSYNELRGNSNTTVPNGGWHFSFMGGPEKVKTKINSYSAQEMNNTHVINSIESNIKNGIDPFFRGNLTKVNIDSSYPEYLVKNINKYKHMIK